MDGTSGLVSLGGDPSLGPPPLDHSPTLFPEFPHLIPEPLSSFHEVNSLQTMASSTTNRSKTNQAYVALLGTEVMTSSSHQKYVFNIVCPISCNSILVGLVRSQDLS